MFTDSDTEEDSSTQSVVLAKRTPSPLQLKPLSKVNDPYPQDIIPASDDDDTLDEDEWENSEKRKRSVNSTPTSKVIGDRGHELPQGHRLSRMSSPYKDVTDPRFENAPPVHEMNISRPTNSEMASYSPERTNVSPSHVPFGSQPSGSLLGLPVRGEPCRQPIPFQDNRGNAVYLTVSDDDDSDADKADDEDDYPNIMDNLKKSATTHGHRTRTFENQSDPDGDGNKHARRRAETSTPVSARRKPFTNIDNLNITAIEKVHSNLNETVETVAADDSSDSDVDEVQSSLGSMTISDSGESRKGKPSGLKVMPKEKLSDIVEGTDTSESESDASIDSIATVRQNPAASKKPVFIGYRDNNIVNPAYTLKKTPQSATKKNFAPLPDTIEIRSSDEKDEEVISVSSSDEENESTVDVDKTDEFENSVESVNSLFDVEAEDDDDDENYRPKKISQKKTTPPKSKLPTKISPVQSSSRGMSKESVKYEFKQSVQKTINELARIIEEMPVADDENDEVERPKNLLVDLYKHQLYGLKWLYWREKQYPGGGILADEMGLGKTVMIMSLVLKSKYEKRRSPSSEEDEWSSQEKSRHKLVPSQSTLVVCPAGMLAQWESEIQTKTKRMTVVVFHGPKRKTSAAVLAQHDFVITTYQTLGSEIPKDIVSRSPLARIQWERVVLDEGHIIRNSTTVAAHGVGCLHANHRWVVTGTPVHNSPKDMFSLISFLRLSPFSDKKVWDFWIGFKGMNQDQSTRLHTIGKSLLLRRTKDEINLNDPSRKIPPKTVVDIEVELSESERQIYDHLRAFAAERFKNFLLDKEKREYEKQTAADNYVAGARKARSGATEVNFTHLFTLILRLRQASVLPYLIHTMLDDDDAEPDLDTSDMDVDIISSRNPSFKSNFKSAKIRQLLHDINKLRREAEEEGRYMDKVIVISQWVKLLSIVTEHLLAAGYSVASINGKMSLEERAEAMRQLNGKRRRPEVMCLSLGAGGVGLNLVGANHVFFMDLHWNPQLEAQAQDRVHRFGQTKPVTVTRYVSKDTIDERVVALQLDKLELADGILTNTKKSQGGGLSIGQMRTLFDL